VGRYADFGGVVTAVLSGDVVGDKLALLVCGVDTIPLVTVVTAVLSEDVAGDKLALLVCGVDTIPLVTVVTAVLSEDVVGDKLALLVCGVDTIPLVTVVTGVAVVTGFDITGSFTGTIISLSGTVLLITI